MGCGRLRLCFGLFRVTRLPGIIYRFLALDEIVCSQSTQSASEHRERQRRLTLLAKQTEILVVWCLRVLRVLFVVERSGQR